MSQDHSREHKAMISARSLWRSATAGLSEDYTLSFASPAFSCRCTANRRRRWHPTPILMPGKSHARRSPVGCSPWGCSESDRTELLHFHFSPSCIGEGNGNPLQYSCLWIPGTGQPGGLPSVGSHRVGHDWSNLAAAAVAALRTSIGAPSPHWKHMAELKSW